jgi:dihydroxyacetone kinase phosphoprotein-dependent L subunit
MDKAKEYLTLEDFASIFADVVDSINKNKEYLCEVDSFIGDGDHGVTLAKGLNSAKGDLDKNPPQTVSALFMTVASAIMRSIGGVCGPIYGSIFLSFAKTAKDKEKIYLSDFIQMLSEGLAAVQKRGGACVGDKTLVDAYAPAVQVLKEHSDKGFIEALETASAAAKEGMLSTKGFASKKGKSKPLGDRSIGYQDAGATSFYLMLNSMRESISKILEEKGGK